MPRIPDSRQRDLTAAIAISVLVLSIAACASGSGGAPTDGPSQPVPASPGQVLTMDQLGGDLGAHDGAPVTVTGFLLITNDDARLCAVSLESYPPQCGGPSLRVLGELSPEFLSSLDSTTEPDLARASWGWVVVSGTVDATGAAGEPTLTISSIALSAT